LGIDNGPPVKDRTVRKRTYLHPNKRSRSVRRSAITMPRWHPDFLTGAAGSYWSARAAPNGQNAAHRWRIPSFVVQPGAYSPLGAEVADRLRAAKQIGSKDFSALPDSEAQVGMR